MDFDGAYILDYLSMSAIKGYKLIWQIPEGRIFKVLKDGLRFIREKNSEIQHQALDDTNKITIARKFALLRSYWLQRIDMVLNECDSDQVLKNARMDSQPSHVNA